MIISYIGIGSNLGNREKNIEKGLELLGENSNIKIESISSIYDTEPVGYKGQDDFLNAVAKISTTLEVGELLKSLQTIEKLINIQPKIKWRPRGLDLDILFYNELIIAKKGLAVPHPLLHKRRFVLIPLVEIEPDLVHPKLKLTVKELLDKVEDKSNVTKLFETKM